MAIKASIRQSNNIKASVSGKKEVVAQTVKVQAGGLVLGDLQDVETAGVSDGSVLIFNGTNSKFEVKNNIENENLAITGGTY
tara:strand:- start:2263 stop:2508 length:246 start_codon:yes stop_codon:yes gene_type:complete